jgi:hypothetical protein
MKTKKETEFTNFFQKTHNLEYDQDGHITVCDDINISGDKHLYICPICDNWIQSKNLYTRTPFHCGEHTKFSCKHERDKFIRVCACDEVI